MATDADAGSCQGGYAADEPVRSDLDAMEGTLLLEFGAPWCGHCQTAQPALRALLSRRWNVRHLKIEDGRGRPLGRSFGVKLWPTLVFLRDGVEIERLVRPQAAGDIAAALRRVVSD